MLMTLNTSVLCLSMKMKCVFDTSENAQQTVPETCQIPRAGLNVLLRLLIKPTCDAGCHL